MDMVLDTVDTDMVDTMVMDSDSTARGLLMLSLRPRLILTTMVDMVSDMPDMPDMDVESTDMVSDTDMDMDTTDMDTDLDMAMVSTDTESRLHQDLSVNQQLELRQKWIVISLNFPSPVLQFQCYHTRSLVMVSRKQENQSGKNPTNIKITKLKK